MPTTSQITQIITKAFLPHYLEVTDESQLHASHREPRDAGGSHYAVTIVSQQFEGIPLLKRHRMVYKVLRKEISENAIHALSIKALTPREWRK